jgi:hypothetical protein
LDAPARIRIASTSGVEMRDRALSYWKIEMPPCGVDPAQNFVSLISAMASSEIAPTLIVFAPARASGNGVRPALTRTRWIEYRRP